MVLAAGYLGFGALANGSQFPLWAALLSTVTIFALPGQLAMLEMSIAGAVPVVIVITVSLTAARFLPMTVALLPMLRSPDRVSWRLYAAVHLLAMTGWAASMRRCPELPLEQTDLVKAAAQPGGPTTCLQVLSQQSFEINRVASTSGSSFWTNFDFAF